MKRWIAWLLTVVLVFAATACEKEKPKPTIKDIKLTIACSGFEGIFSPFYAELPTDQTIADLTQIALLTTDREGNVIYNGIGGETREYNGTSYSYTGPADLMVTTHDDGTVDYDFTLRTDLVFSDDTPLTADDVIFSMYVLCDPMYDGSSSFASLPIKGLKEYQTGMVPKWRLILADTPKTATIGSPDGYYTDEEAVEFWTVFNATGAEYVDEIVNARIQTGWGETVCEVAAAMGYKELPETATATDLFNAMTERYGYDISDQGIDSNKVDTSFEEMLIQRLSAELRCGVATTASSPVIEGIQKIGTHTIRVTLERVDTQALTKMGIAVTPMHYYGDTKLYSYESNMFGFVKGNLSSVQKKSSSPLGAGPYTYFRVHDGVITMKANAKYYKGTPKTERLSFLKTSESKLISRLETGIVYIEEQPLDLKKITEIETVNGGVLNGDILNVRPVDRTTYGYIGMSADGVRVGTDSASAESKALRRALATIFMYYRDAMITEYCGAYATMTDRITRSDASEKTDPHTYTVDIHGNEILADRDDILRGEEAMLDVAREYLRVAGYTLVDGRVTQSPAGGKRTFEVYLVGDETGRNPSYMLMESAQKALKELGIALKIWDYAHNEELQRVIRNERAEIWCGTWEDGYNPDTYTLYHENGGMQYMFDIHDDELNTSILTAARATSEAERIKQYDRCFEIVKEWTVEIPLYEQKHAFVYRPDSIEFDSVTQDVTPHYGWTRDVAETKLKKKTTD